MDNIISSTLVSEVEKFITIDNINNQYYKNRTLLHQAVISVNLDVISFLCKQNASLSVKDANGCDIICTAMLNPCVDVIRLLLKYNKSDLNEVDNRGNNALNLAVTKNADISILEMLCNARIDINHKNHRNETALHLAVISGNNENVVFLLKKGILVNEIDISEKTPLHIASEYGQLKDVKTLLEYGANVQNADIHLNTALHYAVKEKSANIVQILCSQPNCKINKKNSNDSTPLHLAAHNRDAKSIKILVENNANLNVEDSSMIQPIQIIRKNLTLMQNIAELNCLKCINAILEDGEDSKFLWKDERTPTEAVKYIRPYVNILLSKKKIKDYTISDIAVITNNMPIIKEIIVRENNKSDKEAQQMITQVPITSYQIMIFLFNKINISELLK